MRKATKSGVTNDYLLYMLAIKLNRINYAFLGRARDVGKKD